MDEYPFEPRLGRIRSQASRRGRRYLGRVLAAAALAGRSLTGNRKGSCERVGRGVGMGRVLGNAGCFASFRSRRAIVKTRLVRVSAKAVGAARAHLRYIQRDGSPGILYSASDSSVDGREFIDRCSGDRHQFRLILSPEDGDQSRGAAVAQPERNDLAVEKRQKIVTRKRPLKPESLTGRAPELHDQSQKLAALDMFGHSRNAKALAKADHGPQQALAVGAVLRGRNKPAVELDLIEAQFAQIADRGIAGAKVIENNRRARSLEFGKVRASTWKVGEQCGLGDLRLEPFGGKLGSLQRPQHRFRGSL